MRLALEFILGFLLAVVSLAAFAGQLVVIDSTAKNFRPGQIIDDAKPFHLLAGRSVTLIDGNGKVKTLSGPLSAVPGAGAADDSTLVASLSRLIRGGEVTSTIAVMRGVKPKRRSLDAWSVSLTSLVDLCIRADGKLSLKSKPSRIPRILSIKVLPNGPEVSMDWPAGVNRIGWPAGLAAMDGGRYLAKILHKRNIAGMTGRVKETELIVHLVPAGLPTDAHRVVWMAGRGCAGQAKALLADLR